MGRHDLEAIRTENYSNLELYQLLVFLLSSMLEFNTDLGLLPLVIYFLMSGMADALMFECIIFQFRVMNLSLVGYLFKNWHDQALALVILPVILCLISIWIPRSIIFLYG